MQWQVHIETVSMTSMKEIKLEIDVTMQTKNYYQTNF